MLAVSDTSPLRYLIIVEQAELLARLFGVVFIPPAVARELSHPATPPAVRQWIAYPPAWLHIHPLIDLPDSELTATLDAGESEAIQLAIEQRGDPISTDSLSHFPGQVTMDFEP